MTVNTFLICGLLVAGLGTLMWFGWSHEMRRRRTAAIEAERARRAAKLRHSLALRDERQSWRRTVGHGQIPILAVGSYAANELPLILQQFIRSSAADHVGPILLAELDDAQRQACISDIPDVFLDRVIEIRSEHFTVGTSNAPITTVFEYESLWGRDIRTGAREWLALMQRTYRPGMLLTLISPGGMAGLGRPIAELFHERYPHLPIYVATILDDKTPIRDHFPDLRALYSHGDLVRGYILCDNRRASRTADIGLAFLFAGLVGATWIGKHPLNLWNAVALIFPGDRPGQVATISAWAEQLPVYHLDAWEDVFPEIYYTRSELVIEKAMRGIRVLVDRPELQSLALERSESGTTRICLTCTPVAPDHFAAISEEVDDRLESWRTSTDPDLSLQYSSLAAPLTPTTEETPIVVVLLQAIRGAPNQVDDLATGKLLVDKKFLPQRKAVQAVRGSQSSASRNGAPTIEEMEVNP